MKKIQMLLVLSFMILMVSCNESQQESQNKSKNESLKEDLEDESTESSPVMKEGLWRGVLESSGGEVPFGLKIARQGNEYIMYLINGEEQLLLDDTKIKNDSIVIPMHVFDAQIVAKIAPKKLVGYFEKLDTKSSYKINFNAEYGKNFRFKPQNTPPDADISGEWKTTFKTDGEDVLALAQFEQTGSKLTGTFMTKTGDYRYLEGSVFGKNILLSAFDGSHVFLFKAQIEEDKIINGEFWSGKTGYRKWNAERNKNFELENPNEITYLKKGYRQIKFELPSIKNSDEMISLDDEKYKNKVVIIQILGSWCPNCMDETAFLGEWYQENKHKDVAIIGVAFERKGEHQYAEERIKKLAKRYKADYDFVFAGAPNKENRKNVFPMLNEIVAFPTTIFIDKGKKVHKIHAGFSGPSTGKFYKKFKADFDQTVRKLLSK